LFKPIFGKAILAASADDTWALKRRILTQSFYKDKLMKLITLILKLAEKKL
jgi:hypothetical protein